MVSHRLGHNSDFCGFAGLAIALSALRPSVVLATTGALETIPPPSTASTVQAEAAALADDFDAVAAFTDVTGVGSLARWIVPEVSLLSQRALVTLAQLDWLRALLLLRHISSAARDDGLADAGAANASGVSRSEARSSSDVSAIGLATPWDVVSTPTTAKLVHACVSAAAEAALLSRCAARPQGVMSSISIAWSAAVSSGAATAADYVEAAAALAVPAAATMPVGGLPGDASAAWRSLLDPWWVLGNCAAEILSGGASSSQGALPAVTLSVTDDELAALCSVLRMSILVLAPQVKEVLNESAAYCHTPSPCAASCSPLELRHSRIVRCEPGLSSRSGSAKHAQQLSSAAIRPVAEPQRTPLLRLRASRPSLMPELLQ